jgi:hypothetical protein
MIQTQKLRHVGAKRLRPIASGMVRRDETYGIAKEEICSKLHSLEIKSAPVFLFLKVVRVLCANAGDRPSTEQVGTLERIDI